MPGLSRGLGSLIPQTESLTKQVLPQTKEGLDNILVEKISENPYQPRKNFSADQLDDLIASIKEHGIMVPLVVTKTDDGYELIAGERRLRASRALGLKTVPALIRTASDQQKLELALIENIQRQQLGALEEAVAYKALIEEFNLTQAKMAERVGKSRPEIANTIRLLDLPDEMKKALQEGKISKTHGRALLGVRDVQKQKALFEEMLKGKVTVKEAEREVSNVSEHSRTKKNPNILAHEEKLREAIGTRVEISERAGKGKITLHFYSKDELLDLITRLSEI